MNGKSSWWHTKLIPLKDNSEEINRIIGTSYDITPIKNAENEARANEEFIFTLIDTIPNPVFYKNSEKRYIGCNSAFENLVGIERENIYGKTCYEVFSKDIAQVTEYKDMELVEKCKRIEYEIKVRNSKNEIREVKSK
jgi:PAS domain S-box-containing protein